MKSFIPFFIAALFLFPSCSHYRICNNSIYTDSLSCLIQIDHEKILSYKSLYNAKKISDTLASDTKNSFIGFKTHNKEIFENVIKPAVENYRKSLEKLSKQEIVNQLSILTFKVYQSLLQKDFYRWGGDLLDLDDMQTEGVRFQFRYGLDCSGFTVAGYEIAVETGLIDADGILFSSQGYRKFCGETGFKDGGGINGMSNRYRLDTKELDQLGKEILRIEKDGKVNPEDIEKLRAGDIVGRNGHFGILVESGNKLYYLESGGWVVPFCNGNPVDASYALNKFAENGYISVRRCLEFE